MYWKNLHDPNALLPPRAKFNRRIEYLLVVRGDSPKALAARTGIDRKTIERYISHPPINAIGRLIAIADEYGVTLDWLCGRSEDGGPRRMG